MRSAIIFLLLLTIFSAFQQVESRKITQKPKTAPKAPAPAPSAPKKSISNKKSSNSKPDKSWARSMIDSAKNKFGIGKKSSKKPEKPVKLPSFRAQLPAISPTKKSLYERAKEKINKSGMAQKAIGYVKKDLGIGVEGPKKPSKILKYGKKAVEKLFSRKKTRPHSNTGTATGANLQQGYQGTYGSSYRGSFMAAANSEFHRKVDYLKQQLEIMQQKIQDSWNSSEAGTKYKLFEEKKTWNDAQLNCEELGSHLAYLDSQSKNQYATWLLNSSNFTMAWFGLRIEMDSLESENPEEFQNFQNLNGCGVLDAQGSWSISSCSMELPYICQAFRLNALVEIPLSSDNDNDNDNENNVKNP